MINRTLLVATLGAVALAASLVVPVHGSPSALHTNHVTFGGPVGLPGLTLPRGTYVFERVVATNRDVVVVRSADRVKVYFMGATQRTVRPSWLDATRMITLGEPLGGAPPRITAWYPVGERVGYAFVYESN
jgi:hypothetical protein